MPSSKSQRSVCATLSAMVFAASSVASAALLALEPNGKQISGVPISKSGSGIDERGPIALTTVGAGLRKIYHVQSVYVGQLLASDPTKLVRTDAGILDSTAAMDESAMRFDFVYLVSAQQLQGAFHDALQTNNVNLGSAETSALLDAVAQGGGANKGQSITFFIERRPGPEQTATPEIVIYENAAGAQKAISGPAGFGRSVLSMWLGESDDSGVATLKQAFLDYSL